MKPARYYNRPTENEQIWEMGESEKGIHGTYGHCAGAVLDA
jgi:hypothetical protein